MLVRKLPTTSRLATALNDGRPVLTQTDHLLADIWVILARAFFSTEERPLPEDFDHPVRAEVTARERAERKRSLKAKFQQRKRAYGGE